MNSLEVSNLQIWDRHTGRVIVPDSSFRVKQGSCLALVGESGSGKSLTCKAIMRLNKAGLSQSGDIVLDGSPLSQLSEKEMRAIRGKRLCMIMQNGMRAFDPSCVVGVPIRETLSRHFGWSRDEIAARMAEAMTSVMLRDPIGIMNRYPHELSGGMLQRIMIALAIVLEPDIVIADEPTTALDTIAQFETIEQLIRLRARTGCSMIVVSHDMAVVRRVADDMVVMKDGVIVEAGPVRKLQSDARHEYTRRLLGAKLALQQHFQAVMGGDSFVDRNRR